jgi:DNA-binding CsgD family transcriptional regulator
VDIAKREVREILQVQFQTIRNSLGLPGTGEIEVEIMTGQLPDTSFANSNGQSTVSSKAMHAVVTWCEALNGTVSLQSALMELVSGLGAEAGTIVRTQINDPRPARIALCDFARTTPSRSLQRSFADSFFGPLLFKARSATVWQATAHADDATGDPALMEWQAARRLKEFVVLVLASGPQTRDHIELHFREHLPRDIEATIAAMLPDMARVWASRSVGLITRSILNHRKTDSDGFKGNANVRILGADNPLRLSRAEFRVCLLLSSGLMVNAVAQELCLSEPTIRTHLRNIYAKTECSSLAELVFRLMDRRQPPETAYSRTA